jgi:hypothetical protein
MTTRLTLITMAFALAMPVSVGIAQVTPPSTSLDPAATAPRPGEGPQLTPEQKSLIYRMVRQDKTKVAKRPFPAQVGADVPPSLDLYTLPDDAVMQAPVTKLFRVVVVGDKVVLVDPTTMRVVDVIDR